MSRSSEKQPGRSGTPPAGAYCTLEELIHLRYGARELKLSRQRRAVSMLAGPYQTKFRGRGIEFAEVRGYQAGDDIRNIDWRVTARTGRPHTKLFCEERERPVLLLVDQGRSMFFGSRTCCKSVTAVHTAALLAWAALQQNDRVGGIVFNGQEHSTIRPGRKNRNVLGLISEMARMNQALEGKNPESEKGLAEALEELRRIARPGSNLFVVSDFRRFTPSAEKNIYSLSRHNDITAIQIFDPLERELPGKGMYGITDGVERSLMYTGSRELRKKYRSRFKESSESLRHLLGPMSIPLIQLSTADSPQHSLRELLGPR